MNDDYTAMPDASSQISFGANPLQLQGAAVLSDIATTLQGTFLGNLCQHASDNLSGANMEGMDIIKDCVSDLSSFYGVDNVKVCFEQGEPGVHTTGFTDSPNDNWIGGDPAVLKDYAAEYGTDFVKNVGSTPILVEMAKWVWGCEIEFSGYEVDHRGVSLEGVVAPCLAFSCLNHSVDSFTNRVRQALPEVREDFRLVA